LIFRQQAIMPLTVKIFITDQRKIEREYRHDTTRDRRIRDRIKAILPAPEGWHSPGLFRLYACIKPPLIVISATS
jgi:hypothetical protein